MQAHADECGDLDYYPPELAYLNLGSGGTVAAPSASDGCEAIDCGGAGVCVAGGRCECADGFYGPRCSVHGPPLAVAGTQATEAVVASPNGTDSDECGSSR